jgi:hypothetical protein
MVSRSVDSETAIEQRLPAAPLFGKFYRVEILAQPRIDLLELLQRHRQAPSEHGAQSR